MRTLLFKFTIVDITSLSRFFFNFWFYRSYTLFTSYFENLKKRVFSLCFQSTVSFTSWKGNNPEIKTVGEMEWWLTTIKWMYHCGKVTKGDTFHEKSSSYWLLSLEKEMEPWLTLRFYQMTANYQRESTKSRCKLRLTPLHTGMT